MSPLLKKNTKNYQLKMNCFVAGLLAAGIMFFTYLVHSNSLLAGDSTVLRMDLYHQYGPLYAELYDRIVHGYSLVYSWTSGLGGAFLGNLFNYCCSPFALVIFFFGHKNMPEAIAVMILLKAVVSSVLFTYYLNKSTKKEHIVTAAFGVLYAFSGFFIAYSWNIMWLDAMSIFPLVILGIEKIIQDRKPLLFIFALSYTMITNYYMAFMVCMLSVLYFLYFYFGNYPWNDALQAKKKARKQKKAQPAVAAPAENASVPFAGYAPASPSAEAPAANGGFVTFYNQPEPAFAQPAAAAPVAGGPLPPAPKKKPKEKRVPLLQRRFFVSGAVFAFSGILCFMLSAFALLPVAYCLKTSSATGSSFTDDLSTYFNFFDFIANHLPSVDPTIRSSGEIVLPNVYCGMLSVLLLPFFFLSDKIPGKKKVAAVVFLAVFYLSFSVNAFNYIWHGLHFPNDLPYRFSFAYSFLLLTLAYQALLHIREFSRKYYVAVGILSLLFIVIIDKTGSKNVESQTVYLSIIFVIVYVIIAGLHTSPRYLKRSVAGLLVFTVVMELAFSNTGRYVMEQSKKYYTSDYDSYQELSDAVEADDPMLFYRTELSHLRARMDPCWYGYNGTSTFSSMAYEHTSKMMRKLGFFGNNINSYTYFPQTPVFNSMFSIRYIYDNYNLLDENDLYTLVDSRQKSADEEGKYEAYRYNYFLPLTFAVSDRLKKWAPGEYDPFATQNELMYESTGVMNVLKNMSATDLLCENLTETSLDFINDNIFFSVNTADTSVDYTKLTILTDIEKEGNYYVYIGGQNINAVHVISDVMDYNYGSSGIDPFIIDAGTLKEGDQISVEYSIDAGATFANIYFDVVMLDDAAFKKAYDKINSNGVINYTSFKDTAFSGTVNVTNDHSFMFTSIPYDKSWEITVDGQKLEYATEKEVEAEATQGKIIAVGDGLLGFDIAKGEHELQFRYRARGLSSGLCLTAAGLAILICLIVFTVLRKKRLAAEAKAAAELAQAHMQAPAFRPEFERQSFERQGITPDGAFAPAAGEASAAEPLNSAETATHPQTADWQPENAAPKENKETGVSECAEADGETGAAQ